MHYKQDCFGEYHRKFIVFSGWQILGGWLRIRLHSPVQQSLMEFGYLLNHDNYY